MVICLVDNEMVEKNQLVLSRLGHTWILDLDGTILKHNGYKIDGYDSFLEGAKEFLESIPDEDMIIFVTSRTEEYRDVTENFLKSHHVKYAYLIFGAPFGERILVNDKKMSGLVTAVAINTDRDVFANLLVERDQSL